MTTCSTLIYLIKNPYHTINTYIIQVRQRGCAQEESKIYLTGPGQAHRSSLVYNLCCCLILVVCVIEMYQLMKPSFYFF